MKYWVFIILAAAATLPWLLHPGYLFLLDFQGVPSPPWLTLDPVNGIAGSPITILWHALAQITGSSIAQKLLFALVLALAGSATAKLAHKLTGKNMPAIVAGILAMSNLFVINRIAMGHIYILFGYALMPIAILATLRYIQTPKWLNAIYAAAANILVLLTSIHYIVLLPLILIFFAWQYAKEFKLSIKIYITLALPVLTVSCILVAALIAYPKSAIHTITAQDLALFAPQAQCSPSIALDIATLASSWRNTSALIPACKQYPIAYIAHILLLIPIFLGAWKTKRLAIGAVMLAALAYMPVIPAMRDSGKFLADVAILESIFLAYGVAEILTKKHASYWKVLMFVPVLTLSIVLIQYLPRITMPHNYPASWYAWDTSLVQLPEKPNVLFLPWHLYMPFDFTNKTTIANPAQRFFVHAHILQSDASEIQQSNTPPFSYPQEQNFPESFKQFLQQHHIQYVALAHGSSEEALYASALSSLPYLTPHLQNTGLTVWQFAQ